MTYGEAADVVLNSTLDVRKAALFGEAIIVIVYVPILTLAGVEGRCSSRWPSRCCSRSSVRSSRP